MAAPPKPKKKPKKSGKLTKSADTLAKLRTAYPNQGSGPHNGNWSRGNYNNECAIRMSVAIESVVPNFFDKYTEPRSPEGWARGAESLSNWIWKYHLGRPKIYASTADFKAAEKTGGGIVFFKDVFRRSGETAQRGDHIDLWNGQSTIGFGDPSNNAKQVWYWKFK